MKPCPFCGSLNTEATYETLKGYFVLCFQCGCRGPCIRSSGLPYGDMAEARDKWDNRIETESPDAR